MAPRGTVRDGDERHRMTDLPPSGARKGEYAGPATRLAAYAVDVAVSTILLAVLVVGAVVVLALVTGAEVKLRVPSEIGAPATAVWLFLYFFVSWATTGKTPGMSLLGLRVADRDGGEVRPGRAALRSLVFPLSFIGGLGLIGILIGREHRALHDVIAGTIVVYDRDEAAP